MPNRFRGFTLIELLVVVAIIAILGAIIFPVLSRAKSAAQVAKCVSQIRQWGTAFLLYVDDHKGRLPYAGRMGGPGFVWGHSGKRDSGAWYEVLMPYIPHRNDDVALRGVKTDTIRWCPTVETASPEVKDWVLPKGSSYYYNCGHEPSTTETRWMSGLGVNARGPHMADLCGYAMSDVNDPALTPALYEMWSFHRATGAGAVQPYSFVFLDGHASSLRLTLNEFGRRTTVFRSGEMPTGRDISRWYRWN